MHACRKHTLLAVLVNKKHSSGQADLFIYAIGVVASFPAFARLACITTVKTVAFPVTTALGIIPLVIMDNPKLEISITPPLFRKGLAGAK